MKILGIETSCDETAVCLLETTGELPEVTFTVLGNALFSQAHKHTEFGGVFPNLAKREHAQNILPLFEKALSLPHAENPLSEDKKANIARILEREPELALKLISYIETHERPTIDLIAVTHGPGLPPALWVGVTFAEALRAAWDIPAFGTNHMEGHILSSLAKKNGDQYQLSHVTFPVLALLISGGHTEIVLAKNWGEYELIGRTRDDAVGEAYDKVARMMDLPYPGGPQISKLADEARTREKNPDIFLPRPMLKSDDFDFSFSGLKTAVLYLVKKIAPLSDAVKRDIAREFEDAVAEVLFEKTKKALHETGATTFVIGGGVAANAHIRGKFETLHKEFPEVDIRLPSLDITGDNAIMIAIAGAIHILSGDTPSDEPLRAIGTRQLRIEHSRT